MLSIAILAISLLWSLRATVVFGHVDATIANTSLRRIATLVLSAVVLLGPIVTYGLRAGRLRAWSAWFRAPRWRPSAFVPIFGFTALVAAQLSRFHFLSTAVVATRLQHHATFATMSFVVGFALLEELVFRGFALSELARFGTRWFAITSSSAFFALLHVPSWTYYHVGVTWGLLQLVTTFVLGVVLADLVMRTGSLWLAIPLHALDDMVLLP